VPTPDNVVEPRDEPPSATSARKRIDALRSVRPGTANAGPSSQVQGQGGSTMTPNAGMQTPNAGMQTPNAGMQTPSRISQNMYRLKAWADNKFLAWDMLLENNQEAALALLVSFVFEAAALSDMQLSSLSHDPFLFLQELEKDEMNHVFINGNDAYPLTFPRYKDENLKKLNYVFHTAFSIDNTMKILENKQASCNYLKWITRMMTTRCRHVRHAAVAACCATITALEAPLKFVNNQVQSLTQQKNICKPNDRKLGKLNKMLTEVKGQLKSLEEFKNYLLDATKVRHRDTFAFIRILTLRAIEKWILDKPEILNQQWCVHVYILMHDREEIVRRAAMDVLYNWFKELGEKTKFLETIAAKVATNLRDRCGDCDEEVAVKAIQILTLPIVNATLEDTTADQVANEIITSPYPKVREAAAYFINEHIFLNPGIIPADQSEQITEQIAKQSVYMLLEYLESFADRLIFRAKYLVDAFGEKAPCLRDWDTMFHVCTQGEGPITDSMHPLSRKRRDAMMCLLDACVSRVALLDQIEEMRKAINSLLPRLHFLFDICCGVDSQMVPLSGLCLTLLRYMKKRPELRESNLTQQLVDNLKKSLGRDDHYVVTNNAAKCLDIIFTISDTYADEAKDLTETIYLKLSRIFKDASNPNENCVDHVNDLHRFISAGSHLGDVLNGDVILFDKIFNLIRHGPEDFDSFNLKCIQLLFTTINWQISQRVCTQFTKQREFMQCVPERTLIRMYQCMLEKLCNIIKPLDASEFSEHNQPGTRRTVDIRLRTSAFLCWLALKRAAFGASKDIQFYSFGTESRGIHVIPIDREQENIVFNFVKELVELTIDNKARSNEITEEGFSVRASDPLSPLTCAQNDWAGVHDAYGWVENSIMTKKAAQIRGSELLVLAVTVAKAITESPIFSISAGPLGQLIVTFLDKACPKLLQDTAKDFLKSLKDDATAHPDVPMLARKYFSIMQWCVENLIENGDVAEARELAKMLISVMGFSFSVPPELAEPYREHCVQVIEYAIDSHNPNATKVYKCIEPFLRFIKHTDRKALIEKRCQEANMDPSLFLEKKTKKPSKRSKKNEAYYAEEEEPNSQEMSDGPAPMDVDSVH